MWSCSCTGSASCKCLEPPSSLAFLLKLCDWICLPLGSSRRHFQSFPGWKWSGDGTWRNWRSVSPLRPPTQNVSSGFESYFDWLRRDVCDKRDRVRERISPKRHWSNGSVEWRGVEPDFRLVERNNWRVFRPLILARDWPAMKRD